MESTATFALAPPSVLSLKWGHLKHRDEIGDAYLELLDPARKRTREEVAGWQQLRNETARHARGVREMFDVRLTADAEPYPTAREMIASMQDTGVLLISTAHCEHPVWTPEQNVDFRIVHDGLGHYLSGGAFSWDGELSACSIHFRMIRSPLARRALFTECIAQLAAFYRTGDHAGQAIGFLPDHFTKGILHA